jgi:protein-S-isoprenylcysteine O-methyltransferase Ste14
VSGIEPRLPLLLSFLAWPPLGLGILGRQWSLEARVLEGHRLIVEGPYRYVRHPIYAAMPWPFGRQLPPSGRS